MAIVSSETQSISPQRDGRRYVIDRFVDHLGGEHFRTWLAGAADDLDAARAVYAAALLGALKAAEIQKDIAAILADGSLAVGVTTNHITVAEARAALRGAYRSATRVEAIMLGDYLSSLSNAQLQTLFAMTAGEVTTLRANKLTPAASAAATIRATTGA
jgi:hypothetical protein